MGCDWIFFVLGPLLVSTFLLFGFFFFYIRVFFFSNMLVSEAEGEKMISFWSFL